VPRIPDLEEFEKKISSVASTISLTKARKLMNISYPTIRRYVDKGYIRVIRRGNSMQISLDEIERFLREGNRPPQTDPGEKAPPIAAKPQPGIDPNRIIPGKEPDPVEKKDSAFPPYVRNL